MSITILGWMRRMDAQLVGVAFADAGIRSLFEAETGATPYSDTDNEKSLRRYRLSFHAWATKRYDLRPIY